MCVLYILVPTYRNHPSSEHFERDPDPDTIYFRTSNTYVKHIVPSSFLFIFHAFFLYSIKLLKPNYQDRNKSPQRGNTNPQHVASFLGFQILESLQIYYTILYYAILYYAILCYTIIASFCCASELT